MSFTVGFFWQIEVISMFSFCSLMKNLVLAKMFISQLFGKTNRFVFIETTSFPFVLMFFKFTEWNDNLFSFFQS